MDLTLLAASTLAAVNLGFQRMDVGAQPLGDQAPACGAEGIERVMDAAGRVRGMRVLHVSVAGSGGGVPELLGSLLPLAVDAGLTIDWRVLFGGHDLQEVVTGLRDGLQGAESAIPDGAWREYLEACRTAGTALAEADSYDAVVLHDPQALGLAEAMGSGPVVWRCHVDAARPDEPAWERAAPLVDWCSVAVFADEGFAPAGLGSGDVRAIAPGIDPLGPRNAELSPLLAGRALRQLGLDLDRPLCSQLMRLDRWKDPHATLEAFDLVRDELPDLQLVIGCELDGGAEGWSAVKEISDYASARDEVHVLTGYSGKLGNVELGALNQLSRLAVRLSLREGFGLAASEALWRGTPVVGGHDGGTPLQVRDGIDGYLVADPSETARRIVELVRDPGLAIAMGRAGREHVRERFLITRVLEDELRLLASLS